MTDKTEIDDLVRRLREEQPVTQDMESTVHCELQDEAADHIEELEQLVATLEAKLNWVLVERDKTFALMLDRAQTAEANLAKALVWVHDARTALADVPEYHYVAMGCGLEDRCIGDPYEAMQFGWDQAMDRVYDENVNPGDEILRQALAELKGTD